MTLEQAAERGGALWAQEQIAALSAQRRLVAGGFPGTMTEARARVLASLGRERASSWRSTSVADQARAVKLFYAAARRVWLTQQQSEHDDDTEEPACSVE